MGYIKDFETYALTISDLSKRKVFTDLINWIKDNFELKLEIKYNQPMFLMDGTFILAISALKNHMSIAPEVKAMEYFKDEITIAKYDQSSHLFKIKYVDDINYELITRIINFNMNDKKGYSKFWRE